MWVHGVGRCGGFVMSSLSLSVFNVNGWVTLVLAMTMVGFWSQGWDWIGLLWWGLITVVGLD